MEVQVQRSQNELREDLLTTYEVKPDGYVVNEQGKTADQILAAIKAKLDASLLDCLDYDSAASCGVLDYVRYVPGSRTVVYTVRGGSEGWYLHVDMIVKGQIKNLILMKTLDWKPEAIKRLERAVWDIVEG
jgi:hypothetical protein